MGSWLVPSDGLMARWWFTKERSEKVKPQDLLWELTAGFLVLEERLHLTADADSARWWQQMCLLWSLRAVCLSAVWTKSSVLAWDRWCPCMNQPTSPKVPMHILSKPEMPLPEALGMAGGVHTCNQSTCVQTRLYPPPTLSPRTCNLTPDPQLFQMKNRNNQIQSHDH